MTNWHEVIKKRTEETWALMNTFFVKSAKNDGSI